MMIFRMTIALRFMFYYPFWMNSPADDWNRVADVLRALLRTLKEEWGCRLPAAYSQPSTEVDATCDALCLRLARNLGEPLDCPVECRPWILARVKVAQSAARTFAAGGKKPCIPRSQPRLLQMLLVADWHSRFRRIWAELPGVDEDAFPG